MKLYSLYHQSRNSTYSSSWSYRVLAWAAQSLVNLQIWSMIYAIYLYIYHQFPFRAKSSSTLGTGERKESQAGSPHLPSPWALETISSCEKIALLFLDNVVSCWVPLIFQCLYQGILSSYGSRWLVMKVPPPSPQYFSCGNDIRSDAHKEVGEIQTILIRYCINTVIWQRNIIAISFRAHSVPLSYTVCKYGKYQMLPREVLHNSDRLVTGLGKEFLPILRQLGYVCVEQGSAVQKQDAAWFKLCCFPCLSSQTGSNIAITVRCCTSASKLCFLCLHSHFISSIWKMSAAWFIKLALHSVDTCLATYAHKSDSQAF